MNQSFKHNILFPLFAQLPQQIAYPLTSLYGRLQSATKQAEVELIKTQINSVINGSDDRRLTQLAEYYFGMQEREELDAYFFQKLKRKEQIDKFIKLVNFEPVMAAKASGRKIMISTGHFGRYWMAGIGIRAKGLTIGTITRDGGDENIHGLPEAVYQYRLKKLHWLQSRFGGPFLVEGESVRPIYRALEQHVMALLIDVPYATDKDGCIDLPFLGRTGLFPIGAAKIAKRTEAMIFPFYVYESKQGLEAHFLPPLDAASMDAEQIMANLVKLLEQQILQRPELWWLWQVLPIICRK